MKATKTQSQIIRQYLAGRHSRKMPPQSVSAISAATNINKVSARFVLKELFRKGQVRRSTNGKVQVFAHATGGGKNHWVPKGVAHGVVRFFQGYRKSWLTVASVAERVGCSGSQASTVCHDLWSRGLLELEKRIANGRQRVFVRASSQIDSVECVGCDGCGGPLGDRVAFCCKCLPVANTSEPCYLAPGSPEQVKLLTERYAAGIPPFLEYTDSDSYEVPLTSE